jgi:hypothetical protein
MLIMCPAARRLLLVYFFSTLFLQRNLFVYFQLLFVVTVLVHFIRNFIPTVILSVYIYFVVPYF